MLSLEVETPIGDLAMNLALEVERGGRLAIVGPSGAGKTTVLRIIAGLFRPERGRVVCGGETWLDTARNLDLAPERRPCSYVFQDYALFEHMSVLANVTYGLRKIGRKERAGVARGWLEQLGIGHLADRYPGRLSGGERQRVALARALAPGPDLLLLDEPLSALDRQTRFGATRAMRSMIEDAGVTSVMVTHDFSDAALLADRAAVIDAGRIVQIGPVEELAAAPGSAFVADLTGAAVLRGEALADGGDLTRVRLAEGLEVFSTDAVEPGHAVVTFYPWEVSLYGVDDDAPAAGSALNRVKGRIETITRVGNRARVGIDVGQPLIAEITGGSVDRLHFEPGSEVVAVWKASSTRVIGQPPCDIHAT